VTPVLLRGPAAVLEALRLGGDSFSVAHDRGPRRLQTPELRECACPLPDLPGFPISLPEMSRKDLKSQARCRAARCWSALRLDGGLLVLGDLHPQAVS
jgi:hypothetical protein